METVFEVREGGKVTSFGFSKCLAMAYTSRAGATIWQVERESEAEAAVRRINWLEKQLKNSYGITLVPGGSTIAEYVDRSCPPPATKETQLDWNTGQPIDTTGTQQSPTGVWFAYSMPENEWHQFKAADAFNAISRGVAATGPTREAAIANLRAIRALFKSQPK